MSETRAVPGGMLSRRFILNTGDVVDGTGLSALSPVPESEDHGERSYLVAHADWGMLGASGISPELRQSGRPPPGSWETPSGILGDPLRDPIRIPYGFSKFCEILVKFR